MAGIDQFYTPEDVALDLFRAVTKRRVRVVADFAAGDGALLCLASRRWSDATIVANDTDRATASRLRRKHPNWQISSCDFLSDRSVRSSTSLQAVDGNCDVVVLNPPFSYRGWQSWCVNFKGEELKCTRAMAFVLRSIAMLRRGGQLVAVLPEGCLSTIADEMAWSKIRRFHQVEIVRSYGKRTFAGCFPRTILVRIAGGPRAASNTSRAPVLPLHLNVTINPAVTIVRGWIPMHKAELHDGRDSLPIVHSTDLSADGIGSGHVHVKTSRSVSGPAVLVPRVGQPTLTNIAILRSYETVALSDCVIALRTQTDGEAAALLAFLRDVWAIIEAAYGGTCARYVTLAKLQEALKRSGLTNVSVLTPSELAMDSMAQTA